MKYTFLQLKAALMRAPNHAIHLQGGSTATHIIACKHKKFNTPLYVAGIPARSRDKIPLSGNPRKAIAMSNSTARNLRDDLLEDYRDIVLHRAA